ncbi:hypothetical protein ABL78_7170 [Leptomonas seymouri]|uniref:Uncharacterized protein n=1 Tax=Leptomonas seymouri TaxID=5684 RepID=A0A0N1I110_LEPSE|nr:hypothetical protein ABL78_7170 [Leptomonas seymouri]|eukprot:KPI83788.1 hypothetical protein ABL78_7170 [Leptomonas seymouri]
MTARDELSSFFATSLMNIKAQCPSGQSKIVAPTAEERQLLNCNSYGTFAIPLGTFRRHDDVAAYLCRYGSVLQGAGVGAPSTAPAPTTTSRLVWDGSSSSSSSASSDRGLTNCRMSYADYNGVSLLGDRWGSGAYHFQSSSPTALSAKRRTATESVILPAIPATSKSSQPLTFSNPINTARAPTPLPIAVDFSSDDNDELLPNENKTQQFFRLAQRHRDQRVRLMDRQERQHRGQHAAKLQALLASKRGGTASAESAPPPQPPPSEREMVLPKLPRAPQLPPRPDAARRAPLSTAKLQLQSPCCTMPPPAAPATQQPYVYYLPRNGACMVGRHDSDCALAVNGFQTVASEEESESSSGSSSTYSDSGDSDSDSTLAEERELWGVCPLRDFPRVKSPDWAALCSSSESSDSDDENTSECEESGSAASSEEGGGADVEAVFVAPPSPDSAMLAQRDARPPLKKPDDSSTLTKARAEASMYALKVHRSADAGLTVNSSRDTASSTVNLPDSSPTSSSLFTIAQSDSRNNGLPNRLRPFAILALQQQQQHPNPSSPKSAKAYHRLLQPLQRHREGAEKDREGSIAKFFLCPRITSRGEAPTERLRLHRPNGLLHPFKGML